jgi:hypothetical protein
MKWLSDFLKGREYKPASLALRPGDKVESPLNSVDWRAFEAGLLDLLRQDLAAFVREHPGEVFYAIGLDCNALYADILLCANTPATLRARALDDPAASSEKAIARREKMLRWGFGDWEYQGFNLDLPGGIERYKKLLPGHEEIPHPFDQECFLKAATRALITLQTSPEIELLSRTADFEVNCVDHDEDASAGKRRLARVRKSVA